MDKGDRGTQVIRRLYGNHNQQSKASKTRSEPKRSQRSDSQQKQKKILRQTKSDDTKEMC